MAHTQYVIIDNNYFKDVQNPYMIDIYEINLGLRSCTIKTHTHTQISSSLCIHSLTSYANKTDYTKINKQKEIRKLVVHNINPRYNIN